jgi:uncharacterized protein (TIGR03435 family)
VLVFALSPLRVVAGAPQPQPADGSARFDVVSVRPCDPKAPPSPGGRSMSGGQVSPGRTLLNCSPVSLLIERAYVTFADGRYSRPSERSSFDRWHAGPDWIRSERFTIEATADAATPLPVMQGPMLQAVLEDRFKLQVHRETRDVPVLELVVAKGGAKLTPFVPGSCVPYEYTSVPLPPLEPGQRRCLGNTEKSSDGNWLETVDAMTLDDWVRHFDGRAFSLGAPPIMNKTGITGLQTFRYEYSGRLEDMAREFRTQLGLDLRPATGSREFLIIDHVERPVLDEGPAAPARASGPAR